MVHLLLDDSSNNEHNYFGKWVLLLLTIFNFCLELFKPNFSICAVYSYFHKFFDDQSQSITSTFHSFCQFFCLVFMVLIVEDEHVIEFSLLFSPVSLNFNFSIRWQDSPQCSHYDMWTLKVVSLCFDRFSTFKNTLGLFIEFITFLHDFIHPCFAAQPGFGRNSIHQAIVFSLSLSQASEAE